MFGYNSDRKWEWAWWAWIGSFAVLEYKALKSDNPRAPLSYTLRKALGTHHRPINRFAGQVVAGAGIVWVISHLYERSDS